jgi:hypothetical protein
MSETITENLFRNFYGSGLFLEKSAIDINYGFKSKKNTQYKGYPDFFKELNDFIIVVEAKATNQKAAKNEVQYYMLNNIIQKDIIGIAISGQNELKVDYFLKHKDNKKCITLLQNSSLLSVDNIHSVYWKAKYGDSVSQERLTKILNDLNKQFNDKNKVRDTERSLFFSGLMIALKDNNFRNVYQSIQSPSKDDVNKSTILEAINLNDAILSAITKQLENKINNLSKQYSWRDKFAFIKNIDYPLTEYKKIISTVEANVFKPFINNEKHDILGKAYKIFLKRAGKVDNKNIILTPDHIKNLMIKLARLNVDDVILDTCTGTGGFLMEAMNDLIQKAEQNEQKILNIKEKQLIGFEVDAVLFSLACTNMFLHGDGRTNMIFRSSLVGDKNEAILSNEDLLTYIKSIKPTKCIINPPYENNNSIKFAIQAVKYLEPNGKLIIIMPTPTLIQNQKDLTKDLLKMAKLDFVIKMPYNLFNEQGRTVNTSIFGFTKMPQSELDEVLYCNLEDDGFVSVQHKGRIDKNNKWEYIKAHLLDTIYNAKEVLGFSEKRRIYKDGALNCSGFQKINNQNTLMLPIGKLFDIEDGSLASDKSIEGDYDFITGSEEWKKHNEYKHNKEAIVYVTKAGGSLGRSHYVNGKFVASNLCLILTPKKTNEYPVNLKFYNHFLKTKRKQIVSDLADGTSKLTINSTELQEYFIQYIDIQTQNNFVKNHIDNYLNKVQEMQKTITNMENSIDFEFKNIL